jgi:hypothetical protein
MITIKKSDNLFHSKRVALDYLATDVAEPSIGYGAVHWLEMRMAGADNEQQFEQFLDAFFSGLKAAFAVQLFCYERSAQPKSRPRAYAKLFYELRRANIISAERMIEKELEVDEHYSVLAGIIEADEVDNEILLNEIMGHRFRFGRAERKEHAPPAPERLAQLMAQVDFTLLRQGALIELDYLTMLRRFVGPASMVFSYRFDGGDDLVFTAYCGAEVAESVEALVLDSLPKGLPCRKVKSDAADVDGVIERYFGAA